MCEMCHSQQTGRLRSTTTTTSISGSSIQYTIHRMCVRFRLKVQFIYFLRKGKEEEEEEEEEEDEMRRASGGRNREQV